MKLIRVLSLCFLALLGWSKCADAGGLFRRVPEVGEWAAFDFRLTHDTIDSGAPRETHENHFTITVKCVGEETIEDRRHLWIEWVHEWVSEAPLPEVDTNEGIFKALVPEDILVNGDPSLDGVRGWILLPYVDEEPVAFSASDGDSATRATLRNVALILLGGGESSDSEEAERTIEVDGQEHLLTRSESGPMPWPYEVENENETFTAEGTWWLSENLAFGVAAVEVTMSHVNRESEDRLDISFELIATGADAVSDLPDHN